MHHALLFEIGQERAQVLAAEHLAVAERQLEGGAAHVVQQDQQLVRRDARVLGRGAEKELGIAHDELVERLARGHQHAERRAVATPGPAEPLPGGGDGARIAVQDAHVERPDVDAELQRRGRDDAVDVAGAQLLLGGAALGRQVAAAVGERPRRLAGVAVEDVLQVLGEHLDHEPGVGEDDGLEAAI